ncbi:MAG: hypothetical protein PHY87_02925 [Sphaerochaeta sp.]|nr:hypothetical protein [Sphaerochaeta sp.]MDD3928728.1 hypothetical protein [Sphaerochaeta sp.]
MHTKRFALLSLLLCLLVLPLAADVQSAFSYLLPLDTTIGHVVDPAEGSVELLTSQALQSSYDLAWLDRYVPVELHQSFVYTYDQVLSSLLPCKQVLIGEATLRGSLYEVRFRILADTAATGSCVWYLEEHGRMFLLSLTLDRP